MNSATKAFFIAFCLLLAGGLRASAAVWVRGDGTPITVAGCTLVNKQREADATHVYTKNVELTRAINQLYRQLFYRRASCGELQFHALHATSTKKLTAWMLKKSTAWFRSVAGTVYQNRTVSTDRGDWFFLSNGVAKKIPDWLTAVSWGLLMEDRIELPSVLTDLFYANVPFSALLNFSDGPYAATTRSLWLDGTTDTSALPARLAAEVATFRDGNGWPSAFHVFESTSYIKRSASDPYATLLDWTWLAGNPANVTVAFFGDMGTSGSAAAVLQLAKDEGTDLAVILGDFAYNGYDPLLWDAMLTTAFGADFPVLGAIGNHDVEDWALYESLLAGRLARQTELSCSGTTGVDATCAFRGLRFVVSGVGTYGTAGATELTAKLAAATESWKICAWHKNQRAMQIGGKTDETGWEVYEACREAGAIVATAHEHSYSRTLLMTNFTTQSYQDTGSTLPLAPGQTVAFVSGLGGRSIRSQDDTLAANPWWASVYTGTQNATYGALFCAFRENGVPTKATCRFKNINGTVVDRFTLELAS